MRQTVHSRGKESKREGLPLRDLTLQTQKEHSEKERGNRTTIIVHGGRPRRGTSTTIHIYGDGPHRESRINTDTWGRTTQRNKNNC
jgi:hypothetical protein